MNAAPFPERPGGREPPSPTPDALAGFDSVDAAAAAEADDAELAGAPQPEPAPAASAPALRASDAQLAAWLGAVAEQDERALAALYDATFARVYGLVHRIVRRTALADEVVEDTYFQVWRQALRFDAARGAAITWLLAMARSRAIDAIRREARFRHESLDAEGAPEPVSAGAGSDELLEIARHHAELHRALMQLGAQPRQLVSLAFLRGYSHEEIAAQTCMPLGTVKSQIRRALASLRQILGDDELPALAS